MLDLHGFNTLRAAMKILVLALAFKQCAFSRQPGDTRERWRGSI
jgi:hypothetical protein